ncbi:uncharacterized protein KGF55_003285 [Candida pseudojiufengensis]|uniref:uncharacterized protein n=1 Tax=Candida pseudojiufengensis TaxID=497109 RepID=UPI002224C108|nr:uncharacterized protein KGF55_003285 [Candida pseudojiufengensis]KAI5962209.1 hypothetical protein KGF55_003285 [Candida pseudojiufengensis]
MKVQNQTNSYRNHFKVVLLLLTIFTITYTIFNSNILDSRSITFSKFKQSIPNFQSNEITGFTNKRNDDEKSTTSINNTSSSKSSTKTTNSNTSSATTTADSDSSDESKPTPIYNRSWMRFIFVLFGFIFLNLIAICIHHVYMKVTRSHNTYRSFEDEKSPF